MGVIFDEVIASVEAPRPVQHEAGAAQPPATHDDEEMKTVRLLETRERRQLRLRAD